MAPLPEIDRITEISQQSLGLHLLILFGSRARGDDYPGSDWDFGYLADADFDPDDLLARLTLALETDHVDLVNLDRANGLLRYRAAAEAQVLFESDPDQFAEFWFKAVSYWCDMGPIIRAGYEEVLEGLSR